TRAWSLTIHFYPLTACMCQLGVRNVGYREAVKIGDLLLVRDEHSNPCRNCEVTEYQKPGFFELTGFIKIQERLTV
ncbi:hypothetical protein QUA82_13705, partial [Microcoleus sp. F8-D3]